MQSFRKLKLIEILSVVLPLRIQKYNLSRDIYCFIFCLHSEKKVLHFTKVSEEQSSELKLFFSHFKVKAFFFARISYGIPPNKRIGNWISSEICKFLNAKWYIFYAALFFHAVLNYFKQRRIIGTCQKIFLRDVKNKISELYIMVCSSYPNSIKLYHFFLSNIW